MELQEKLHCLRKENGISQIELAEELDVSRQTISRWEAGTSVPTTENLMRLSKLYHVPLDVWMNKDRVPSAVSGPVPDLDAQAEPDTPSEDTACGPLQKPYPKWLKWALPLAAFLLGIGFAVGMKFFLEWREQPASTDELKSEVIDFSTISTEWPLLPPTE